MNDPSSENDPTSEPRVVIIGAGFGGLQAARTLARAAPQARITLVDRHNYHTFTPLLYQVATAALEAEEIAHPVRPILRGPHAIAFRVTEVSSIDLAARVVQTDRGPLPYDYLIVAAGSVTNFFGLPGVSAVSDGLKDLPEALALRNRLLLLFERTVEEREEQGQLASLTLVVVGGGPTGVELAGAISELTLQILQHDFPALQPDRVRILLLEAGPRLLPTFRPRLSAAALRTLEQRGVEVFLNATVRAADDSNIHLADGSTIRASLLIWAAGVRASGLASDLAPTVASAGRVPVLPTLQLPDHPEVYVIGDMAELRERGQLLPMLAPVAMQQGHHAARNLARQMTAVPLLPFRYRDRGIMATIGRSAAVAQVGPLSIAGFLAWVAWLVLHLVELIGFRNRVLVLINWIWSYFFFDRAVRVITGPAEPDNR